MCVANYHHICIEGRNYIKIVKCIINMFLNYVEKGIEDLLGDCIMLREVIVAMVLTNSWVKKGDNIIIKYTNKIISERKLYID